MSEFIEIIIKDFDIQNEISQTIERYNNESLSTRTTIGQRALIQNKVSEQAKIIMGVTF